METANITAPEARRILKMLSGWTVNELVESGTFDLVAKLAMIGKGDVYTAYINVGAGNKVSGIKLLRGLLSLGLKEAKDHYERYDMYSEGKDVIVGVFSVEDVERLRVIAKDYGYLSGTLWFEQGDRT